METDRVINVLIVDDEERFRKTTAASLGKRGFWVRTAPRGWEAIREVSRYNIDVVVLDIKMPGMDGHAVLREIKGIRPDIQVIMLTGHGSLGSALESWRDEAFTYLTKPCDIDVLAEMIEYAYAEKVNSADDMSSQATGLPSPQSRSVFRRLLSPNRRSRTGTGCSREGTHRYGAEKKNPGADRKR